MPPAVYGSGWHRPNKCDCGKIPYPDEATALDAAHRLGEANDAVLTVYKCPGSTRWHKTGHGFHPRSLKSRPRIIAWHLSVRRVFSREGLYRELGINPAFDEDRGPKKRVSAVLRAFADLGLIRLDDPKRSYMTAVNFDGLLRVMQVGLQEYAEAHGTSVTKPAPAEPDDGRQEPQP